MKKKIAMMGALLLLLAPITTSSIAFAEEATHEVTPISEKLDGGKTEDEESGDNNGIMKLGGELDDTQSSEGQAKDPSLLRDGTKASQKDSTNTKTIALVVTVVLVIVGAGAVVLFRKKKVAE